MLLESKSKFPHRLNISLWSLHDLKHAKPHGAWVRILLKIKQDFANLLGASRGVHGVPTDHLFTQGATVHQAFPGRPSPWPEFGKWLVRSMPFGMPQPRAQLHGKSCRKGQHWPGHPGQFRLPASFSAPQTFRIWP